jgi:peptide deformylase
MKIITYPNPVLREKSKEIKNPTNPKIKQLITDMTKALRANQGLGLAAPQVGENLNLCIIEIEDELFVLINPEIKSRSDEKIVAEEGCLSFPGKFMPVERSKRVKIKSTDATGKNQIIRARGLFARALQHEIDHLNGELFIDKVSEQKE